MDCTVAKIKNSSLCYEIIWDEVPPNRRKADDSYCGLDRGGSVYLEHQVLFA